VRTIARGGVWGAGSPRKAPHRHPPAPLRLPVNLSRSREAEGGRIGPPGAGRKREAGPPTGEIMGDRPSKSPLLPVGEAAGAEARRERMWVGCLRGLRGTDRSNPLGEACGGLGGERGGGESACGEGRGF